MEYAININEEVWVHLTPAGVEVFRADIEKYPLPEGLTTEQVISIHDAGGGWSKFRLYELMSIFGHKLRNGAVDRMFGSNTIFFTPPV